jgi:hypothetical protein
MSRTVKLVLLGVGAAALLYSCAPGMGGLGGLPYLWFLRNPFFRGAAPTSTVTAPGPTKPLATQQSRRGGFGGSARSFGAGS